MQLPTRARGCIMETCEDSLWMHDRADGRGQEEAASLPRAGEAEDLPSFGEVHREAALHARGLREARTPQEASEEVTAKDGAADRAKEARAAVNPQAR